MADETVTESRIPGLGPTGRFPQGKLNRHDQGEQRMAVASKSGKVLIVFGSPTAWIGMDPQQARDLAALLVKHADGVV